MARAQLVEGSALVSIESVVVGGLIGWASPVVVGGAVGAASSSSSWASPACTGLGWLVRHDKRGVLLRLVLVDPAGSRGCYLTVHGPLEAAMC